MFQVAPLSKLPSKDFSTCSAQASAGCGSRTTSTVLQVHPSMMWVRGILWRMLATTTLLLLCLLVKQQVVTAGRLWFEWNIVLISN